MGLGGLLGSGGIFGSNSTISTMDPNQRLSFNSLINSYQRQMANGSDPDTESVNAYLKKTINPDIIRNADESMNQAKANMGSGFWGSNKLSALASLQRQKNESLDSAQATAMETERQNAQNRYDQARQGLSGLMNVQTMAQQYNPGFLDRTNQVVGTVSNAAGLAKNMAGWGKLSSKQQPALTKTGKPA